MTFFVLDFISVIATNKLNSLYCFIDFTDFQISFRRERTYIFFTSLKNAGYVIIIEFNFKEINSS